MHMWNNDTSVCVCDSESESESESEGVYECWTESVSGCLCNCYVSISTTTFNRIMTNSATFNSMC